MKSIKSRLLLVLLFCLCAEANNLYASDCSDFGMGWSQAKLAKPRIEFCYPSKYKIQVENDQVFIVPKISSKHRQTFLSKNKLDLVFQGKRVLAPSDYIAHIKIGIGNFKKANAAEQIFEKKITGMQPRIGRVINPEPAKPISNGGWSGYEAIVPCSMSDENGFHAIAGECLWAMASDNKNYFIVDTIGEFGTLDEVMKIIKTIRFITL